MRTTLRLAIAAGLLAAGLLLSGRDGPAPVAASHGNLNVHVHDNYYHAAGTFIVGSGTDHNLAKAGCEKAVPDAECTAVIHVGDTITWVSPAPLAVEPHSVTECTDTNFNVCGPSVSTDNPIGDSGVRAPPSPGPSGWPYGPIQFNVAGTYYYRCEVHPDVMRGRVLVLGAVGGKVQLASGDGAAQPQPGGSSLSGAAGAAIAAAAAVAAAGAFALAAAAWYWRRRRLR